jgi:hypothetical protein
VRQRQQQLPPGQQQQSISNAPSAAFGALAALAGAPYQAHRVLLSDKVSASNWEQLLTHDCRQAFTVIFKQLLLSQQISSSGCDVGGGGIMPVPGLGASALQSYLDTVGESATTEPQGMLDKYRANTFTSSDGAHTLLSLRGFLQFACDRANASNVGEDVLWRDLRAYHFRGDLSVDTAAAASAAATGFGGDVSMVVEEPSSSPPSPSSISNPDYSMADSGATVSAMSGLSLGTGNGDADADSDSSVKATSDGYHIATADPNDSDNDEVPGLVPAPVISAPIITDNVLNNQNRVVVVGNGDNAVDPAENHAFGMATRRLVVDEVSEGVLRCPDLYAMGMEVAPMATRGLLQCASYEAEDLSRALLLDALQKLAHFTSAGDDNAANAVCVLLTALVSLGDTLQTVRGELLLMHPTMGLVPTIARELEQPSQLANSWDRGAKERYVEYLDRFTTSTAAVRELLLRLASSDVSARRATRQLKKPGSPFSEEESDLVQDCTLLLKDTGYPELDGEYSFDRIFHGAGM